MEPNSQYIIGQTNKWRNRSTAMFASDQELKPKAISVMKGFRNAKTRACREVAPKKASGRHRVVRRAWIAGGKDFGFLAVVVVTVALVVVVIIAAVAVAVAVVAAAVAAAAAVVVVVVVLVVLVVLVVGAVAVVAAAAAGGGYVT